MFIITLLIFYFLPLNRFVMYNYFETFTNAHLVT